MPRRCFTAWPCHKLLFILVTLIGFSVCGDIAISQDSVYMFSYFNNISDGADGLHLAYSLDGLSYHAVNGDVAVTGPMAGTTTRDPYTFLGQDGKFHLLHTTEPWTVNTKICYGESDDLLTWTNKKYIDVMGSIPGTQQAWAPECYWDATNSRYLIYWSSQVGTGTGAHFKIYYSTTTDFNTFSSPAVLYDHGDTRIDADIVKDGSNYVMFLAGTSKAQGDSNLYGPYSTNLQQLTSGYSSEGPSAIKIGDTWLVYNDHYTTGVMGAMASTDDMATWNEYTSYVSFPINPANNANARHGDVFTVPIAVARNLAANAANKPAEDEFIGSAGTSDFHTAANWFAGSVPGANQTPVIQGGHTVDLTSSPSGALYGLKVGQSSAGTLNISGNTVVNINSRWPNGLLVGDCATGVGEIVQSGNSSVSVAGTSGFVSIGKYGRGTYRLQGGSLSATGDFNVGDIRGSHGEVYVENGTLTLVNLYIGSGYNSGFSTGNAEGAVYQSGGAVTVTGSGDMVVIGGRDNNLYGVGTFALSGSGTFDSGNNANILVGKYGQGTFTQSGGMLYARQGFSIGRYAGSTGAYSISDGILYQTNASNRVTVGYAGTGTLTVSGTGIVDTVTGLRVSQSASSNGSVHLDGGTIFTPFVEDGGGTAQFHFNGGTLKARNATTTFLQDLNTVDVESGGAIIDTNGFNITIAQPLLAGSPSGGLTKNGLGLLTLAGNPTYTGDTIINAGQLQLNTGSTSLAAISGPGQLIVGSLATPTQLTAANIAVGSLIIAANSKVIINSLGAAQPLAATAVPEPAVLLLLLMTAAVLCIKRR